MAEGRHRTTIRRTGSATGVSSSSHSRVLRNTRSARSSKVALQERRRKALIVLSWLSMILAIIGLIFSVIPAGFIAGVALFLVPGFVLGLIALAMRSDKVWAAVVGVVTSVIGGHVSLASFAIVLVMVGGGIQLPSFDLSSLTSGLNLSGLKIPSFKIPSFHFPSLKVPKVGGLSGPSKSSIASLIDGKKNNGKAAPTPKPSPTPTPGPTPGPTPDPTPQNIYNVGEVIVTQSGLTLVVSDFQCGFSEVETEAGTLAPNGQFCEAHVALQNTTGKNIVIDDSALTVLVDDFEALPEESSSGFWLVDDAGDPIEGTVLNDEGVDLGPRLYPKLTVADTGYAFGVVTFDINVDAYPDYLHIEGDWFPDAVSVVVN